MSRRMYIVPRSAADEDGISDIAALDNLLEGANATEDVVVPEDVDDPADEPEDNPEPMPQPKPDKAGNAFAQMRIQNKQLTDALAKVAQATGLEYKNTDELLQKLNEDALSKIAQKQNVPVELLQRMSELEQIQQEFQAQKLEQSAMLGFQSVQTQYGLTNEQLQEFAAELDEADMNPFVKPVDLLAQYKLIHYDEIVQKQIEAAVQAALAKDSVASKHSSTPSKATGKPDSTPTEPISTVRGLDALLDGMNK